MKKYNHLEIEPKWQAYWESKKLANIDLDKAGKPFYNLMMFPYPSAEGLHIGSVYTFSGIDTFGRYKKMKGYDVFEPFGLDGFGIHSENYAIKIKENILDVSKRTEKHYYNQMKRTGTMIDWDRTVETYKPEYYKWTQWLFIQLFKAGLAYRKKSDVNWCPSCKTVLSDEQVEGGLCERCKSEVTKKTTTQWFLKITEYAQRLLDNLEWIDWMEDVKTGQKNWIGRKEGINIQYEVEGIEKKITVFTTRPDTNFGATFIALAPDGQYTKENLSKFPNRAEVEQYIEKTKLRSELERQADKKKTGVFTGLFALNNLNGKKMPVYVSDFVLGTVGTGSLVGVPGHDKRDFEFAQEKDLDIIRVVVGSDGDKTSIKNIAQVQEEEGVMINSGFLDGMNIHDATEKIIDHMEEKGWGKRVIEFKIRDWVISRQRYWGPPIPMIYCEKCEKDNMGFHSDSLPGWWPDENLPVKLPEIKEFEDTLPDGSVKGPLAKFSEFYNVKCPKCRSDARRETDVSDPFVDSCWYFLRYLFTEYQEIPFGGNFTGKKSLFSPTISDKKLKIAIKRMKKWGPVTSYIGGKEHTVLHLLYARFITMVLKDLGYLDFEEPFKWFFGHGLITKDGSKMSKSKGNIIVPDEYFDKYGADAVRMYLRFMGAFDQGGDWADESMQGMYKFVQKLWGIYQEYNDNPGKKCDDIHDGKLHKTIKQVDEDLDKLKFNTAVARIMELVNWYQENKKKISQTQRKEILTNLALILAPFMPHITEEFWEILGNKASIHQQPWPDFDASKIVDPTVTIAIQINGKLRDTIEVVTGLDKDKVKEKSVKRPRIETYVKGKTIKKVIFVPDRILNVIV